MAYSTDLRKRVLDFIEAGGKKAEAARRFSVERSTIYHPRMVSFRFLARFWTPQVPMRVLDEAALWRFPRLDALHISVFQFIVYGLELGITRKKKQSDIRSGAMRNVKSVRHSPRNTPLAKR